MLAYLFLAFAPGVFWLWYFRRKDELEPEPRHLVVRSFLAGAIGGLLVLFARPELDALLPAAGTWCGLVIDAYGITATVEECVKLSAFLAVAYFHSEFDEPLDGIIYGVAVALGFASLENFLYLRATGQPALILQRAFTSMLAHVAFTGSLGYFMGIAKFSGGPWKAYSMVGGLSLAVLLHGTYDFFLLSSDSYPTLALAVILPLSLVLFGLKLRWHKARSADYHPPAPR